MMKIPQGVRYKQAPLQLGNRSMCITVAAMRPMAANMTADMFIDMDLSTDSSQLASHLSLYPVGWGLFGSNSLPDVSIAIKQSMKVEDVPEQLPGLVKEALDFADRATAESAWINFSDENAELIPGEVHDAYLAILDGVRLFAEGTHAEDAVQGSLGEVIVAVSDKTYLILEAGNLLPPVAEVFPAAMLPDGES